MADEGPKWAAVAVTIGLAISVTEERLRSHQGAELRGTADGT